MASTKTRSSIPVVSLFSGPGGMDLGFRRQGFLPIVAIDSDPAAVRTYNFNDRRGIAQCRDLAELTDEEVIALVIQIAPNMRPRGVIGGAPCQSFSSSNVHARPNDPRKQLLYRYAQIVGALNKKFCLDFFVFENVIGLKSKKHVRYFRKIVREFESAGFAVFEGALNANDFGVGQDRTRLFLIGINKRVYPNLSFDFPTRSESNKVSVRQVVGDLPEPAYFKRGLRLKDIPYHPNHWTMNPKSDKFKNGSNGKGRSFRTLDWDQPSWTVAYGNREMHIHPTGARRVSVFEAMRLQGFPKSYRLLGNLSQQVTQVSDAVPPPLAAAMAKAIRRTVYSPVETLQDNLLDWFESEERYFPWRRTSNPYRVLLAEKLLQQTAASKSVVVAYQELIAKYPSVQALSQASPRDIRKIIASLGFAYRGEELTRLAKEVVDRYAGKIPTEIKGLLSLPGVGDYAARAVLSFAHNQDVPIVDTNIARMLHRVFGLSHPLPTNPARNKRLIDIASILVPKGKSREFNLAALDLCSMVCKAQNPECYRCPIRNSCERGKNC